MHVKLLRGAAILTALMTGCSTMDGPLEVPFRILDDPQSKAVTVFDGEAPVLTYRYGDQLPDGMPADRTRSCYLHPIHGLDGEVLTDDFPRDHPHHRGLSLMWPRMKIDGQPCELWHIRGVRALFSRWLEMEAHPDRAILVAENWWTLGDGRRAAREIARIVVHPASGIGRALDVTFAIDVGEWPIELLGAPSKGYGGIFLRFAPREDTVITTDVRSGAPDSDLERHAWADLSGRFGDREAMSGIALLAAPDFPESPPPWTLRNYGGVGIAWPGLEPVTLEPGGSLRLACRLWIHRGDATVGRVEAAMAEWRGDAAR